MRLQPEQRKVARHGTLGDAGVGRHGAAILPATSPLQVLHAAYSERVPWR